MKRTAFLITLSLTSTICLSQTYYDRQAQNREYQRLQDATQRAYNVPSSSSSSSSFKSPSSGSYSSPSGTSSSSSSSGAGGTILPPQPYFNWGATDNYDRQVRLAAQRERDAEVRQAALDAGKSAFSALISKKGLARTEGDYFDLMLVGMRAGYDGNVIFSVLGNSLEDYVKKYGTTGPPFKATGGVEERADKYLKELNTEKSPFLRSILYAHIIRAYPTSENYGKLAVEYFAGNEFAKAVLSFDTAIAKDGGINRFYSEGRAAAYAFSGNLTVAKTAYEQILRDDPAAFAEMNLAWIALRQGDKATALKYVKAASAKRPEDAGALLATAILTTDAGAAQRLADGASGLRPDIGQGSIPSRVFAYAKLLHAAGDFHSSLLFLDMAVAAEPKNVEFLELRFGTNTKLNQIKDAARDEETLSNL